MFFHWHNIFTALTLIFAFSASVVRAENEGQEDLDKAAEAKLSATTISHLGEVIRRIESALQKGLDDSNTAFAKKLLASAYIQRGTAVTQTIFKSPTPDPRWPQYRQFALADLEKGIKLDPQQPQVLILIAQLNLLPEGDEKRAREAINQAIEDAGDDPQLQAKALVIRAGMQKDLQKRLPDLNEAVRLAPKEADPVRSRGLVLADLQKYDESLEDLNKALELDAKNASTFEAKAIVLTRLKKYDEALEVLDEAQTLAPNSIAPWLQKTHIHSLQKKLDLAIEDLNRAAAIDVGNVSVLLLRSSMYQEIGDKEKALADAEEALRLRPKFPLAIRTYAALLVEMGKFDKALDELIRLRALDPNDPLSTMQLAQVYLRQKSSSKAIEVYDEFLKQHPNDPNVLRARADAYLNTGKQAEAIADFEKAYKELPKDSGLLNNFAWVLATSPEEKLRDGPRAVKLATEACELTEYKLPHILSTLAAAYAETGDFDNALKWSSKAVEIGSEEHGAELKKELESYQARKPWRELLSEDTSTTEEDKANKTQEKPEAEDKSAPTGEKADQSAAAAPQAEKPAQNIIQPSNGKNLNGWTVKQPEENSNWTTGVAQIDPQNPAGLIASFAGNQPGELINLEGGGVDIYTVQKFGDCTIELEFMVPKGSNSGVYVMGEYEVQIFDSFGKTILEPNDLGAIFGAAVPKVNAAKASGEWQSLMIEFQAPRFADGQKNANACFIKVTLNGQVIHENLEMKGPTPGGLTGKEAPEGPLLFQGNHGPVAYRNIKITIPAH